MLVLKLGHRQMEVTQAGSLFVRTTRTEVFVQRNKAAPWWPRHDPAGNGEGEWRGLGLKVTYNPAPVEPVRFPEDAWPAAR